ncbi:MAG: hypothetical protein AAGI15_01270 [Pseudomonadota bacterium]
MLRIIGLILLIGAAIAAYLAPIGPMPGVRLGGIETAAPQQWADVPIPMTVQLKTTGGSLPRVVNIWVVNHNNELYVFGQADSGWVQAASANPAVPLRMGDAAYALTAVREADTASAAYGAYLDRYRADYPELVGSLPPASEGLAAGAAFRLTRS